MLNSDGYNEENAEILDRVRTVLRDAKRDNALAVVVKRKDLDALLAVHDPVDTDEASAIIKRLLREGVTDADLIAEKMVKLFRSWMDSAMFRSNIVYDGLEPD